MRQVTIARGAAYELASFGNGVAYELRAPDGRSIFVQGDEATAFRDEFDAMEAAGPERDSGAILAELFSRYGGGE